MARKTVDVEFVKGVVNRALDTHTSSREERRAMAFVLEQVLHETGQYKGFRYLHSEYAAEGEPWAEGTTHLRVGYDETRRQYL